MRPLPRETRKEKALTKIFRWALIPSVFLIDRVFKIWVLRYLKEGESLPVGGSLFHITRVNNTGAAFGLWRHASFYLAAAAAVSILIILSYLVRNPRPVRAHFYGWSLVAAGALGNLYDRLHFGYVVDFLDFRVWPVFNVADSAICVGVFLVLWNAFRHASHPA